MIASLVGICGLLSTGHVGSLPHLDSLTERLHGPARLAVAPDGSLYVSDPLRGSIVRFDALGEFSAEWPVAEGPIGVAVHPDGRVFVSLRDEPKVAVYNSAFTFLGHLGNEDPRVSFVGPTDIDIAVDTGRIYVVDSEADRIYGFESDGSLALILGSRGVWPGQFVYPSAITIDEPRNRIIVADHDKCRLQVFTTAGVFLQQFGDRLKSSAGVLEGWMPRPLGLTADAEGHVYLSDALMGTIRVFDPTGAELGKSAGYGYEPGQLRVPCGLAVSNDGTRLYVASTNSSSVEVYGTTDVLGSSEYDGGAFATDGRSEPLSAVPGALTVHDILQQTDELWPNGPHRVEERPDICGPCHRINGQPGDSGGTLEGQGVLCMSCHTGTGRAFRVPIHEYDVADPFGTNPSAADGLGRSHAWGVSVENPSADAEAPGRPMSGYLEDGGIINCSTCHEQHLSGISPYLRMSNDGDAMCKECHAALDQVEPEGGSHRVGWPFPFYQGEYPSIEDLDPLVLKEDMMECTTCHAVHGADSGGANDGHGDGMLLRTANDETLCLICHTQHTTHTGIEHRDIRPTCLDCHDIHDPDNDNYKMIRREINGVPVSFSADVVRLCGTWTVGGPDYIHSINDPPTYDGICEVCHTTTAQHRNSPDGDHAHNSCMTCVTCHMHWEGFQPPPWLCTHCHEEPPGGEGGTGRWP